MKKIMLLSILVSLLSLWMCDKPDVVPVSKVQFSIDCDTVFVYGTNEADLNIKLYNPEVMDRMVITVRNAESSATVAELHSSDFVSGSHNLVCGVNITTIAAVMVFDAYNTAGECTTRKIIVHNAPPQLALEYPKYVSRVTGKQLQDERFPSPNNTHTRFGLSGTDLGIMWDMGNGRIGMIFGDSYGGNIIPGSSGGPNATFTSWRSNVLAFSSDTDFSDGLYIDSMAVAANNPFYAREIMYSAKNGDGRDYTTIPSGAIHADGKDYIHYWNLRTWNNWTINYAGFYCSDDHGATWYDCPQLRFNGNSRFGMVSLAKRDGYVYMIGSHSGRDSMPYLARFLESDILNHDAYEYWNGTEQVWIRGNENSGTPLFNAPLGESSLYFHPKWKKWLLFSTGSDGLKYRMADTITGHWSDGRMLFSAWGCYAAMIHPFNNDDDCIWFNVSMWGPYNVFFMRSEVTMKYN